MATVPTRSPRTAAQISEVMRRIPTKNTEPEAIFRKALRSAGVRSFRACVLDLPGKPDIVIPGKRLAIFIDGDFWHGNQYRVRGFDSLDEQAVLNSKRCLLDDEDMRKCGKGLQKHSALLDAGWRVLRFWESEVYADVHPCVSRTLSALGANSRRGTALRLWRFATPDSGRALCRNRLD